MKKHFGFFTENFELHTQEGELVAVEDWPVSRIMRGEFITNVELIGKRRDTGRTWYFSFSGSPVLDEKGKLILSLIVTRDITDQKKTQIALIENEERFRSFAESIPNLAFMTDASGNITYTNSRYKDYFGFKAEAVQSGRWKELKLQHPEDLSPTIEKWNDAINTGKPYQMENRLRRYDGQYRWHLSRAIPIRNGEGRIKQWVGISTDIHDQKESARRLQEGIIARDEFLSIVSHELKTPLTSLKMQSQMLLRGIQKGDPDVCTSDNIAKFALTTDHHVNRLSRLVNDMLDIGRIRTGNLRIQTEPLRLNGLVSEVVERIRPDMQMGGTPVIFECREDIDGKWDRGRIEQVINNLLTNAMRYGDRKPATVRLEKREGKAVLSVTDQGIGIEKENLERIFNRFERAISPNEVSGLGLGLFITQQIVTAHGGKIWAESAGINLGSSFIVELPIGS